MAFTIKHVFQSLKSDGVDVSLVQPSNWNDNHNIQMDAFTVVGRASGAGAASGLPFSWFIMPIGGIIPYAPSVLPDASWMFCDGTAIDRITYSALFTAIGTAYGAGNGTTTFNIPDLRGRVPAGKDTIGTRLTSTSMSPDGNTLGATGGAQSKSTTVSGSISGSTAGSLSVAATGSTGPDSALTNVTVGPTSVASHTHLHDVSVNGFTSGTLSVSGSFSGSSAAFVTVQPTLIVNYIMKVLSNP
jgi:microcystin-dependent protein